MIVGNGILANALKKYDGDNLILFASGVSNSMETKQAEFDRELDLLKETLEKNPNRKLIYFSTCSINDPSKKNSLYVNHKLNIEKFIKNNCRFYVIFRVGNAVGKGGNPHTLINFLSRQIKNEIQFSLYSKARRLLIDIDDVAKFVTENQHNFKNDIINLAFPYQFQLKEIISAIEKKLDIKAKYQEISEGDFYDVEFDRSVIDYFSKQSSEDYLSHLIKKYLSYGY